MAKRSAESQLTKDSRSDDEDDEGGQNGFKRADEKTLSNRVIRGMPKRAGGTPAASPAGNGTPDTPTPPPRFAGFGSLTSASPATSSSPAAGASPFSFTSKPFPEPATSAFPSSKEQSATSKAFASFLSANPTPPASPTSDGNDEDLFKFYKQLRGLNVSLTDACKKALLADPFADLSPIFKQYTEHRTTIDKSRPTLSTSTKPVNGTSSAFPSAPAPEVKPPSVPASFSFSPFGSTSASSSSPAKPASSAPPVFPSFTPPATGATTAPPLSFSTDSPSSPPKPSIFGSSAADDKTTKSSFSFGTPSGASFGATPAAPTSDDKTTKPPAFSFGIPEAGKSSFSFGDSSKLGGDAKSSTSIFSTGSSNFGTSSLFSSSTSGSSLFSSSATPAAASSSEGSPPKTTPTFGTFGSSTSFGSTASLFGGAAKGSLGNPVGFSFGASTKPAESSSASSTPAPAADDAAEREGTPGGVDVPEGAGVALEPSAYDKEGAGEEEEETMYEERCKAYRLDKKDGKMEWVDLGIGMLRCKKHKTTGTRRILMRNSGSGRIILNFGVFKSLKPTQEKSFVSFVAMDGSNPASYRIKVKNAALAVQMRDAIVKEVEAVAAKD